MIYKWSLRLFCYDYNDSAVGHGHSQTEKCEVIATLGFLDGTSLSCLLPSLLPPPFTPASGSTDFFFPTDQVVLIRTVFRLSC